VTLVSAYSIDNRYIDYRNPTRGRAIDDRAHEQHPDRPRQSRWFSLPRVSAADWDAVGESQIPAGTDVHGEANFVIRRTPDAPFAVSVHAFC